MSVKYAVRVLAVPLGTIEVASQKYQTTIQQEKYSILKECPCQQYEITPWFSIRRANQVYKWSVYWCRYFAAF